MQVRAVPSVPTGTGGMAGEDDNLAADLIYNREDAATEAMPLTYRECVYLVPPGTSEARAERLLRSKLASVQESVDDCPRASS